MGDGKRQADTKPGPAGEAVSRDCSIPPDTAVFIVPAASFQTDCAPEEQGSGEQMCTPSDADYGLLLPDWAAAQMQSFMERTDVRIDVDGVPIANPTQYLFASEEVFWASAPADDPFLDCTAPMEPNSCEYPVGDRRMGAAGFGIMLEPLPPGDHIIRVLRSEFDCSRWTDVAYEITVE